MYKHYIKIDENYNVIDYFCEVQQYKLDGTEIFYRDNQERQANLDLINENTYYWKYYYNPDTQRIVEKTKEMDFDVYKDMKKREIRLAFENSFRKSVFMSDTLGIDVDCRRSDTKNDRENCKILLNYMQRNNVNNIMYVGHKESVDITVEQLQDLIIEMEEYGLNLYNYKWVLESEIEAAKTIKDLEAITWTI